MDDVRKPARWPVVVAAALFLLAAILYLHRIGASSVWLDELFALELSTGKGFVHEHLPLNAPPAGHAWDDTRLDGFHPLWIWAGQVNDSHPPLYFVALGAWRLVFGSGDTAVRLLSTLFALTALALVYLCVKRQAGDGPAFWTLAILAVSGTFIQYAQEARNYTMAMALLYGVVFLLIRAQREAVFSWRIVSLLAVLLWAGFVTHYLFLGPAAGAAAWALFALPRKLRLRLVAAGGIAAALVAITWLPFFLTQRANGFEDKITWMGRSPGHSPLQAVFQLQTWAWETLLVDALTPATARSLLSLTLLFAIIQGVRHAAVRVWAATLAGGLLLVILTDILDGTNRLAVTRYTVLLAPALIATLVLGVWPIRGMRHLLPAAIVLLCAVRLPGAYEDRKADWRGITRWLEENAGSGDLVVFTAPKESAWIGGACQLAMAHYQTWPEDGAPKLMLIDRPPTADLRDAMLNHAGRVWIVSPHYGPPPDGIAEALPLTAGKHFEPTMSIYGLERAEEIHPAADERR